MDTEDEDEGDNDSRKRLNMEVIFDETESRPSFHSTMSFNNTLLLQNTIPFVVEMPKYLSSWTDHSCL